MYLQQLPDGRMLFFPTTLTLRPDEEAPISVKSSRRVELRGWTDQDLCARLGAAGFDARLHGDMEGGAYDAQESHDLVIVATRL